MKSIRLTSPDLNELISLISSISRRMKSSNNESHLPGFCYSAQVMLIPAVVEKGLVVKIPCHLHTKRKRIRMIPFIPGANIRRILCQFVNNVGRLCIRSVLIKVDDFLPSTLVSTNSKCNKHFVSSY